MSDTLKQAQQEIESTNQDAAVTDVRNQTIKAIEQIKPKVRRNELRLIALKKIIKINSMQSEIRWILLKMKEMLLLIL
ncbi:hypothetical protein ACV56Z_17525 [Staphylococcus aureus]